MAHPIEDVAPDAIGAATTAQLDAGIDAWLHPFENYDQNLQVISAQFGFAWGGLTGRSAVAQPFAALTNCSFQYSDFSGLALAGFDFSTCQFRECVFDGCALAGADFSGAPLGRTAFTRCDLQKADFRRAEAYAIDPAANKLKGARFSFPEVVALLDSAGIQIE